jgi:hypothetical protein
MTTNNAINSNFPITSRLPVYFIGPIFLSTTDLANLATVSKLCIPAPGSGFANMPFFAIAESSAGTTYSGSDSATFVNGSNTLIAFTTNLGLSGSSVLNSNSSSITGTSTGDYTVLDNQPIYLLAPSLTGAGSQTCKVWIRYNIIPLV